LYLIPASHRREADAWRVRALMTLHQGFGADSKLSCWFSLNKN